MALSRLSTFVLALAFLCGAVFCVLCDLAARTALAPVELPIGVVTSLIGAGVFFMIYIRSRKRRRRP